MLMAKHAEQESFSGWRMAALLFVVLNVVLGVNFGSYGALVGAIETEFGTSRALASAGSSVLTLSMGLLSPFAGALMSRFPIKLLMMAGALASAAGYLLIAHVHSVYAMLACYGLLIGPGFCLVGIIPCTNIVSNWFVSGRGKAIGLMNMPFGNMVMPLAAAALVQMAGVRTTFLFFGVLMASLVPLLLLLVDHPARVGQRAKGAVSGVVAGDIAVAKVAPGQLLRMPALWIMTLGVGILSAAGLVMVTHLAVLATSRGLDLGSASMLLAALGMAGLAGAPLFGWMADRIGGAKAFAILSLAQIPPWLGLIVAGANFPFLLLLAFGIGLCCNGILTLFGTLTAEWMGRERVGIAMGMSYLLQVPLIFGAAPLAGLLFDASGSYDLAIYLHVGSFVLIGLVFLLYRPAVTRRGDDAEMADMMMIKEEIS